MSDGTLVLENASTALGVVEPLAQFGSSAFGPLQARAISADGIPGEWISLGTLVRLPGFKELHCPHNPARPCSLTGTNLFLASRFQHRLISTMRWMCRWISPARTGVTASRERDADLKLRDDPATVQTLALSATPLTPGATVPVTPVAPTAVKPAADTKPADQQSAQTPGPPPSKATPRICSKFFRLLRANDYWK